MYAGDLILQKYYTVDFLTKKTALNTGQLPQYFVENSHPAVVPKEVYLQVQAEMARRRHHWVDFRYSHKNALGGRTICAECGTPFRRAGSHWRCETRVNKKRHPGIECSNGSIKESDLKKAVVRAFESLPERSEELARLEERLHWGGLTRADEVLAAIETEMGNLEQRMARADEEERADCQEKLRTLQEQWSAASEQRAVYADKALQIQSLQDRIKVMAGEAEKGVKHRNGSCENAEDFYRLTRPEYHDGAYTDDDVIRFVEKIVVGGEKVTVVFKAGISVDVMR